MRSNMMDVIHHGPDDPAFRTTGVHLTGISESPLVHVHYGMHICAAVTSLD